MKRGRRHHVHMRGAIQPRIVWITLLLLGFAYSIPIAAQLTAQSMSGTVEILSVGQQTWRPLTAISTLQTGDQVRTGQNSTVNLWFEDGSVLNLAEETQLAVSELNVSTAQKTRIARFKLWWGSVTAKVTKLAFTENVCEIETDTFVAGVKFAEMTVTHPQSVAQSEVIARQGMVSIRRFDVDDRMVNVVGALSEQDRVQFVLPARIGAEVFVTVQKILAKVEISSPRMLSNIQPIFEPVNNFIKIDNESESPVTLHVNDTSATLQAKSSTTVGIPSTQDMFVNTLEPTDIVFSIKRRTAAILCEGLYVFLNGGTLDVNGEAVKIGVPNCFSFQFAAAQPSEARERSLIQTRQAISPGGAAEVPVVPASPQANAPQGATGEQTPIIITPIPFGTPTPDEVPTPTPEEELTPTPEEEEPTPTPEEEPTATPPPPPPPTRTPASPVTQ